MIDLWPASIEVTKTTAPVTILRQQAAMLGKKTKNLIEAEVVNADQVVGDFDFGYNFYIVAPALNNYRFLLLRTLHNVELYPLYIETGDDIFKEISQKFNALNNIYIKVESEEEFLEVLRAIFNSSKTKRVLSAILAQSTQGFKPSASSDDEDEN